MTQHTPQRLSVKIRPPSACNPARLRVSLARASRASCPFVCWRASGGIRARCVRVLDARSFARGGRRVRACVRSFASVVVNGTARVQRLEEPSSSSARRRRRGGRRRRRTRRTKTKKASVRVATTRRGGRRAGTRRRRRGRDDDDDDAIRDSTRSWSRRRAGAAMHTSSCIHSCMHSNRMRPLALFSKFECI